MCLQSGCIWQQTTGERTVLFYYFFFTFLFFFSSFIYFGQPKIFPWPLGGTVSPPNLEVIVHSFISVLPGKLSLQSWESLLCRNLPFQSAKQCEKVQSVKLDCFRQVFGWVCSWSSSDCIFSLSEGLKSWFDSRGIAYDAWLCNLHQWDFTRGCLTSHQVTRSHYFSFSLP